MRSTVHWAALLLLVGSAAPGCNDESQSGDDNRRSSTSGGEGGGGEGGDLEAPPGSVEPSDDGGDLEAEATSQSGSSQSGSSQSGSSQSGSSQSGSSQSGSSQSGTGGGGGTTAAGPAAGTQPAESPWGAPETETGAPLPPRRPMSSAARSPYQRGLREAAAGNNEAAGASFRQALAADGNAFKAAYNLGVMSDRAGQESQALEFYERALRIQPDYERAILGVARIHLRRGDAAQAVSFVRPLADRWVRNLHVQAIYGDVLVGANRPEEAIQAARRALRRDERFVPAMVVLVKANLRLGRGELAESILDQAIVTSDTNAELHYLRGRLHQEAGNLAPALVSYRRAIELEPAYTEARMALGLQQLAAGNYTEALEQFRTSANLAPTLVSVRLALGDAYRATKAWQQAKGEYDRVQEMQPRNAEVHFNLGVMYLEAEDGYPGSTKIQAYQRSITEFNRYRELMGPRMARGDASQTYLEELGRLIDREQRAQERDAARAQREAERAARQTAPAEGGGAAGNEGQ